MSLPETLPLPDQSDPLTVAGGGGIVAVFALPVSPSALTPLSLAAAQARANPA